MPSALQFVDDIHISAVFYDVLRLAVAGDFQITAGVDRYVVCDAAVEDEQPACVAVVDRGAVCLAAAGDVHIAAVFDLGVDYDAAGKDDQAVIILNDPGAGFAVLNIIYHKEYLFAGLEPL